MPGIFGHLIGAWAIARIYNKITNTKFTRLMWPALLLGATLPDTDFLIDWTIDGLYTHRTFTHSMFISITICIIIYAILSLINHFRKQTFPKPKILASLFFIGMNIHILLDLVTGSSGLQLFWPFNDEWITLNQPLQHIHTPPTYLELRRNLNATTFDMALGYIWIAYLYLRKKIWFD